MFYYIRSGSSDKAVAYLYESGHIAKAAMMNGFAYTEKMSLGYDTTEGFEVQMDGANGSTTNLQLSGPDVGVLRYEVSGNFERDMWKNIAFSICQSNGLTKYERAALGALCGHRQSMVNVAGSWEDKVNTSWVLSIMVIE